MPHFGSRSLEQLAGVDDRLQEMCHRAIKIVDFAVISGYRGKDIQNHLFEMGQSKLKFPFSKHNTSPAHAVDCVPWPVDWQDHRRFYYLAGIFQAIAHDLGFILRHGGDWDQDDIFKDQQFFDLPHFEIYE